MCMASPSTKQRKSKRKGKMVRKLVKRMSFKKRPSSRSRQHMIGFDELRKHKQTSTMKSGAASGLSRVCRAMWLATHSCSLCGWTRLWPPCMIIYTTAICLYAYIKHHQIGINTSRLA